MQQRHRLRQASVIRALRTHGDCLRHPLAVLCYSNNDVAESRFCFSVSRRVGNAVVRNRTKRRMREAVRINLQQIKPGYDFLLIARAATASADFWQVEAAILHLLSRAKLLEKPSLLPMDD